MIARLTGTILAKGEGSLVLDVQGVGYEIFVTEKQLGSTPHIGDAATFFTHHAIRENAQELYGFISQDDLDMFEMLLTVNGVGPKAGMAILSQASPQEVVQAVTTSDTSRLTKVSGIGKKTAERIVLELKSKMKDMTITNVETGVDILSSESHALDALVALGCTQQEAEAALRKIMKPEMTVEDQVKEALKVLGAR